MGYELYLLTKIISGDELPDQICSTCAQNTIKLFLFKIQCEESDRTLRNRLKEGPCIVIDKIDIDEEDIFDKIKSEIKEENVEVSDVYEDYNDCTSSPQSLNTSIAEESLEDDLSQEKDTLRHNKLAEIVQKMKIIEEKFDSQRHEINKDKITKNNGEAKSVVICLEDCNKMSSLKSSIETIKGQTPLFNSEKKKCFVFTKSISLAKPFECDVCKHRFRRSCDLIVHIRTHTGEKPYKCNVCRKRFAVSSALTIHKRTHTGEKPYECDVCKKKFNHTSNLTYHKRNHTDEKPYECEVCKQRFKQSSALIVHKRTHTGEKPYECDVCKRRFSRLCSVTVHKRTHTGEKPYKCNVCKQRFAVSSTLTTHKRTHTGEKPFECDVCKHRFSRSSDLTIHKRTHTGEKPHECDVCKMRFSNSSNLVVHKRTHKGAILNKRKVRRS